MATRPLMVKLKLKDAFSGEPPKMSSFDVKILKILSEDRFLISDDSGSYCEMLIDPPNHKNRGLLKVNAVLRVKNPKFDFEKKVLVIQQSSTIIHGPQKPDWTEATIEDVAEMHSEDVKTKPLTITVKVLQRKAENSYLVTDAT